MADGAAAEKSAAKTVKAVVAQRRSVQSDRRYGPGETLALPAQEAERLRKAGFLADPAAEMPPVASGPTFSTQEGPQISRG